MAESKKAAGCARPTGGVVGETEEAPQQTTSQELKESKGMEARGMIQVGKKAPDFTAPAYHQGEFTSVQLSDHLGKWMVLCFYPGDFTFV